MKKKNNSVERQLDKLGVGRNNIVVNIGFLIKIHVL